MNIEKLKELETLLSEADDFGIPFGFYMDHFGDKPGFIRESKKTKAPLIKLMVNEAGQDSFKKIPVRIVNMAMLLCARLSIIHGGGFIEGELFTFFYCKRINKGMMCITSKKSGTRMIRITPKIVDGAEMNEDFIDSVDSEENIKKQFINRYPN